MQRDPIGIRGGLNVYVYAECNPTDAVDPDGRTSFLPDPSGKLYLTARERNVLRRVSERIPYSRFTPFYQRARQSIFARHLCRANAIAAGKLVLMAGSAYGGYKAGNLFTEGVRQEYGRTGWDMIFQWYWDGQYGVRPANKGRLDY